MKRSHLFMIFANFLLGHTIQFAGSPLSSHDNDHLVYDVQTLKKQNQFQEDLSYNPFDTPEAYQHDAIQLMLKENHTKPETKEITIGQIIVAQHKLANKSN